MTAWESQNAKQWSKIRFVLQEEARGGVFWITCDQFQHRQHLLQEFCARFPNYDHTIGKIDHFSGGSLPSYMLDVFVSLGGHPEATRPQMFHVSGLERYLSHTSEEGKEGFFEALNFERPLFFEALPFVLVFWTDSHTLVKTHRLAGDFWEWLTNKYDFDGPGDALVADTTVGQDWSQRFWEQMNPEAAELLHNRNARLLALLDEQSRDVDRLSLWVSLADNYNKLREFEQSLQYRRPALAELQGKDEAAYQWQLSELAKTIFRHGQLLAVRGEYEAARRLYNEALELLQAGVMRKARADILTNLGDLESRLGNLDSARALFEEAIGHFKTERDHLGLANALTMLGELEFRLGNLDSARALYEEAIGHFKTERAHLGLANALKSLGELEHRLENLDLARALYEEAIGHYKTERAHLGLANALRSLGDLEFRLGNLDLARALYEEAIGHYKTERAHLGLANALRGLGNLDRLQGKLDSARALYEEAIGHYKTERAHLGLANALKNLGDLESRRGNLEGALALYQQATAHYQSEREPMGLGQTFAKMASIYHQLGQFEARDQAYAAARAAAETSHSPQLISYVEENGKAWLGD